MLNIFFYGGNFMKTIADVNVHSASALLTKCATKCSYVVACLNSTKNYEPRTKRSLTQILRDCFLRVFRGQDLQTKPPLSRLYTRWKKGKRELQCVLIKMFSFWKSLQ